jgi:hypothetical protein
MLIGDRQPDPPDRSDWTVYGITDDRGEPPLDPASRAVARTPQPVDWTIGEALWFLHPRPPRRTVARWLKGLDPIGKRELPQGGPPARTYPAAEIMLRHATWVRRKSPPEG